MIRVDQLSVRLGEFTLGPIDLQVGDGEYFAVVGPTGSGKTMLLETLAGIHLPRSGRIEFHGRDVTNLPPERRDVGFVYQRSMLFPHLSVRDNILYGLRYRRASQDERERRLADLAELLGIGYLLDRSVDGLSGGESQKVALARALAIQPSVLFFDEPMGPLDQSSKEALREELKRLHKRLPTTTLHVEHDRDTAFMLGDRIGVMNHGIIEQAGTADELVNRPNTEFVARFLGTENVFRAESRSDGDGSVVTLACGQVRSNCKRSGEVAMCLHGERIAILPQPAAISDANQVQGVVDEALMQHAVVIVSVRTAAERFVVHRPPDEAVPPVGTTVWLAFRPEDVHLAEPSP
jgi:ABC-type sugar transport system ATPase subunit